MASIFKIILAILIFSFIILFHELGHFIVAKKCNVKVNEFMLGLGPRLFGVQKGETMYSLHLLPFGGACAMEGEDEESDDERAFNKKPVWQRLLIVFAGPFFNFLLAYIIAVILIGVAGYYPATITGVVEGSPAEEAGLQDGDTFVSFNHYRIHFYNEITLYTFFHPGQTLDVTYERNGKRNTVQITPEYNEESGRYMLGVYAEGDTEKEGAFSTLAYGGYEIKYQIYVVFQSLKMLVTGQVGLQDMAGPVGIVKAIGDTYDESIIDGVYYVVLNMLSFMVLLSANLGVMNLLPFPALDGGRIVLFLVEIIRGGKKLDPNVEGKINFVGFALLMVLMVVIMVSDISKLFA